MSYWCGNEPWGPFTDDGLDFTPCFREVAFETAIPVSFLIFTLTVYGAKPLLESCMWPFRSQESKRSSGSETTPLLSHPQDQRIGQSGYSTNGPSYQQHNSSSGDPLSTSRAHFVPALQHDMTAKVCADESTYQNRACQDPEAIENRSLRSFMLRRIEGRVLSNQRHYFVISPSLSFFFVCMSWQQTKRRRRHCCCSQRITRIRIPGQNHLSTIPPTATLFFFWSL
ncbi:MAG: hypothetical protein J3Q66DRAFT_177040 [Benniella sp.]|nr:MAG: hypothetical protein J3Q66DRAFT_177040 [Benniella sp.]